MLAGRVNVDTVFPCVALELGSRSGRVAELPFTNQYFHVYVYRGVEAMSTPDFTEIDPIQEAVFNALHGTSLSLTGVGAKALYCLHDNYRSGDLFDERRRAYYKYDRYRVNLVLSSHYH